ncbi:MAG: sarcosine oxidase subunit delta [Pseudomonadota bacterium]
MQQFTCPFCGKRDEPEFHFVVEAGKPRPEPASEVSDEKWAAYLHMGKAPKGTAREIWLHTTCGLYFLMTRDTVTREVTDVAYLPGVGK